MHISLHAVVPICGLIFNLIVTVILIKYGTSRLHYKFLLFNLVANVWLLQVICYYLAPDIRIVDICSRFVLSGMFLAPIATINFCYELCGYPQKQKRLSLGIMGFFTLFIIILNAAGRFVDGYTHYKNIKWIVIPTPIYKVFMAYFVFSILVYMPFLLIKTYQRSIDHNRRTQILYILAAIGLSILIASTNFFSNLGIPVYPLGPLGTLVFTSIVTYAIIRHELLDIQVVIRKTLLFTSLSVFVSAVYAIILSLFYLLTQQYSPSNSVIAGFIAVIVISFLFQPARDRIQAILEKLFHRRKADYNRLLQEMSSTLTRFTDPHNLFTWIGNHLLMSMQMEWIDLYLLNSKSDKYESVGKIRGKYAKPGSEPDRHAYEKIHPLITAIATAQTAVMKIGEQEWNFLRNDSLLVSLIFENELLGFYILGPKLSEQPYDRDDETLLNAIASQTAAAVRTMNLFNEMEKVRHAMYEQDKMAALGTLAFGIAHEIKNPLTPIKTFTQKMISKAETDREREMGQRVTSEFKRVEDMLNNLLNYGRTGADKRENVDLNKLLADTLVLFSADLRHGRIIREEQYEASLPPVRVEANRLVQVFLNLITNASQAMPDGGTLSVSTNRENNQAVIRFKDTGTGMPPEVLDKIFMPLYTNKASGTGLGLAISTNILNEYNGSIVASSTPGLGSEFTITLPLSGI